MTFSTKKPSQNLRIAGIVVLAASIGIILTVGRDPLTVEKVEDSLNRFAEYVAADTARSGKQGSFTHGGIEMQGWLFNRYAVVRDLTLEVSKQSVLDTISWSLSTPVMAVKPDQVIARRLNYVFGAPITLSKNGNPVAEMVFSDHLQYSQLETRRGETNTLVQSYKLPSGITISPLPAVEGAESVVISYAKNPVAEISSSLERSERQAQYEFHNISVKAGDALPLTIGSLRSELSEKPGADGLLDGHYALNLAALKTDATEKPCDAVADISYTGDQPLMKLAGFVAGSENTTVNVQKLTLDCADFAVNAEGNLARSPQDPLPNGMVKVKIDQVGAFLASGLLSPQARDLLTQTLVKVTGQPVDSLTTVEIPLKREKNGTFYVGDVTFEELATSMLSNMFDIKRLPAPATPVPPQETPAAEPAPDQMMDELHEDLGVPPEADEFGGPVEDEDVNRLEPGMD